MALWFLIAWTTLVMPFLALSVELPHLLTARLTVSHAARAALAAAFTQCSDLARYQTAAHELPRQQSAACMAQSTPRAQATSVTSAPSRRIAPAPTGTRWSVSSGTGPGRE